MAIFAHYGMLREYTIAQGGTAGAAAMALVAAVIGLVLSLILWFCIARRANNGAKWVVVAFTAISVVMTVYDSFADGYTGLSTSYIAMEVFALALAVIATFFLFRRDAVRWLSSRGIDGVIDVQVFE